MLAPLFFELLHISIHALREEGDRRSARGWSVCINFYPRPPRGGRPYFLAQAGLSKIFLSTPSARRATIVCGVWPHIVSISIHALREEGDRVAAFFSRFLQKFLSTPSARRATAIWVLSRLVSRISIHALREEGDSCR